MKQEKGRNTMGGGRIEMIVREENHRVMESCLASFSHQMSSSTVSIESSQRDPSFRTTCGVVEIHVYH